MLSHAKKCLLYFEIESNELSVHFNFREEVAESHQTMHTKKITNFNQLGPPLGSSKLVFNLSIQLFSVQANSLSKIA